MVQFLNYVSESNTREEALTKLWGERSVFEEEDKLEEFEKLEKKIKETPVLNLLAAIDLRSEDLVKIRERLGLDRFLDVKVDPTLIGGCVLIWQGNVYDYSLKKTLADKKVEFRKILRLLNLI